MININSDFRIVRYKQGIRLAEPATISGDLYTDVSSVLRLPVSACFYDVENTFVNVNDSCLIAAGVDSVNDMLGKHPGKFTDEKLDEKTIANNNTVMKAKQVIVSEETGFRVDGALIQSISIKLPWFHKDEVVGLLAFSIYTDSDSLQEFATKMSGVISTGLLGPSYPQALQHKVKLDDIHLSNREIELLGLMMRGFTGKQISEKLGISKRTVEHHIEHIKNKAACRTKSELIDKFYDYFD